MNPLTQVKNTQKITAREQAIGISEEGSWHAKFKNSAYVYVGGLPFDLTEGDVLAVFSQRWMITLVLALSRFAFLFVVWLIMNCQWRSLKVWYNVEPRGLELLLMELGDRAVGFLLLLISTTLFAYYTFWVIITPFVDTDHFVHNYFPDREYAIIIPGLAGAALLSFVLIFVGVVMVKSRHPKPMSKPKTT